MYHIQGWVQLQNTCCTCVFMHIEYCTWIEPLFDLESTSPFQMLYSVLGTHFSVILLLLLLFVVVVVVVRYLNTVWGGLSFSHTNDTSTDILGTLMSCYVFRICK